ncbi:MAG: GDSL-type esterase/lipase family protein [Oscillospiraceae bacterium]
MSELTRFSAETADVRRLGRTVIRSGVIWLGYSLSGVEFDFCGTSLSAELTTDWVNDEPWKHIFQPYIAVLVNGKLEKRIAVNEGKAVYDLFSCEKAEKVRIRIVKLSENAFSKVGLSALLADGEIMPTKPLSELRIEFVGDSITCGFGIEGKSAAEGFTTATENPLVNYASLTAERLGAEYQLVSWTAIGVYSNSVKDDRTEPDNGWTMPVIYDYIDKSTDLMLGNEPELCDFSAFAPQLIVVNLGTNDKDFTRGIPERTAAFEKCYREFILHIREKNPQAYILCVLGVMGQELCPQVENAVKSLADEKISAMRFDVQSEADGIGSEEHPNLTTHKKMSDRLYEEIERLKFF